MKIKTSLGTKKDYKPLFHSLKGVILELLGLVLYGIINRIIMALLAW